MPHHEDMHQGSDPVGFLPDQMEIHIADKLDYTERSIRALLAHQSRIQDPLLADRLDRIREEIQQSLAEQRSAKTAGVSTEVFSQIDIQVGPDGPSTPISSKRSFAAQATSPNGL